MSSTPGYEYKYRLSMHDYRLSMHDDEFDFSERKRRHDEMILPDELDLSKRKRRFVFVFRTNFVIKGRRDFEMTIDSERFRACFVEGKTSRMHLEISAAYRLIEYSMPGEKIDALIEDAAEIAEQLVSHYELRVIPILVEIDVCTVQLEDEDLCDALSRAIRARDLQPLDDSASNLFSI